MNFKKIIAVTVAALMLAFSLVSCGGSTAADINVTVKIIADDATMLDTSVTIGDNSNVLDAVEAACKANDIDITFSDDEADVKSIGEYDTFESEDATRYYWFFKLDGKEVAGAALDNAVTDGMVVEYVYAAAESRFVTFKVIVDDEVFIEEQVAEGFLQNIIMQACDSYELSDDGKTVEDIGDYETYKDGTNDCYWVYRLNGKKVSDYDVSNDEIKAGDTVEFTYVRDTAE